MYINVPMDVPHIERCIKGEINGLKVSRYRALKVIGLLLIFVNLLVHLLTVEVQSRSLQVPCEPPRSLVSPSWPFSPSS